jgi:hypothetical protein
MSALKGFKAFFKIKEAKVEVPTPVLVEKESVEIQGDNEEEIIKKIEDVYYEENDSMCEKELMRLPEFDVYFIEERIQHLAIQEKAISSCLVRIISDNHFAYVQEMDSVIGIQESLQDAHSTCCNARNCLDRAKKGISVGTLGLLAKHRFKSRTECLFDTFKDLQQLRTLSVQFREFLKVPLYPQVVRLCVASSQFLKDFDEFDCVSDLEEKFQDGMRKAQMDIDEELGQLYKQFDPNNFLVLYEVLKLTGSVQEAVKTAINGFRAGIRDLSFAVVAESLQKCSEPRDCYAEGKHFSVLCKDVFPSQFAGTLRYLAKEFFSVMLNYAKLKKWFGSVAEGGSHGQVCNSVQIETKELEGATISIWEEIERHVKLYMEACDFSALKYDDVISVLRTVQVLSVAEFEFTGSRSEALQVSIRQLTLKYFKLYHRSKMESLHAMMQNEAWEAVPVEENFSLSLLPVKCCVHNFITVKGYYMYVFGSAIGKSKSSRTSAKES